MISFSVDKQRKSCMCYKKVIIPKSICINVVKENSSKMQYCPLTTDFATHTELYTINISAPISHKNHNLIHIHAHSSFSNTLKTNLPSTTIAFPVRITHPRTFSPHPRSQLAARNTSGAGQRLRNDARLISVSHGCGGARNAGGKADIMNSRGPPVSSDCLSLAQAFRGERLCGT